MQQKVRLQQNQDLEDDY